jgi:hypothetical protein
LTTIAVKVAITRAGVGQRKELDRGLIDVERTFSSSLPRLSASNPPVVHEIAGSGLGLGLGLGLDRSALVRPVRPVRR